MRIILIASLALLALGGCHRRHNQPANTSTPALNTKPGIVFSGGRLVLPAVPGNPGALYLTLANQGSALAHVVGVEVAGADKAELHETRGSTMEPLKLVPLEPGRTVIFSPGGKHVMVFGLKPSVRPGAMVEVTLHFFDGKTFPAQAKVETAGGDDMTDATAGMPGMDHDMSGMAGMASSR